MPTEERDPHEQESPNASRKYEVRTSSEAVQVEGNRVIVNDPALAKVLRERQELNESGEEGISIIIGPGPSSL
jgi:hypothetical protein